MITPFRSRIKPAPVGGGFAMEEYWVWCGSVTAGDDGLFHMFASRIPKNLPFSPHWLTHSEIVHAVSPTPEGPYAFSDVSLPPRDPMFWDGRMTHNPAIVRHGGRYLLYYTATTFAAAPPTPETPMQVFSPLFFEALVNQYIGLAWADSPYGPWHRPDDPILRPRSGCWDECMATNPAPFVEPGGRVLLGYKSGPDPLRHGWPMILNYGMACAESWDAPYLRLVDEPLFHFDDPGVRIEDACIWHEDGVYQMLLNDLTGKVTGEDHSGIHAWSVDAKRWQVADPPQAYSRNVLWDDGARIKQGSLERPQVLLQDGVPTHLFCATADGPGGFQNAANTWNMVIPLSKRMGKS